MAVFGQCFNSHKYRKFVIASTQEGRRQGIMVIPTVLVNNQRIIEGLLSFEELQPIIEEELNKAP
jgi:predicted DsbA family dithiol-disulfide isomerase